MMTRSWESKGMSEDSAHVEIDERAPSWVATLDKEEFRAEHPAFRAWARVNGSQDAPTKIEVLKQTKRKTMICRLSGSGKQMENVIAKRSFRHYIGVERIIYAEILPSLPVTSLRYYGSTEDDDPNYEWLFIEDATGSACNLRCQATRIAAGDRKS